MENNCRSCIHWRQKNEGGRIGTCTELGDHVGIAHPEMPPSARIVFLVDLDFHCPAFEIDEAISQFTPDYEAEDIGCKCTMEGIASEWEWDVEENIWKCERCGEVQ